MTDLWNNVISDIILELFEKKLICIKLQAFLFFLKLPIVIKCREEKIQNLTPTTT